MKQSPISDGSLIDIVVFLTDIADKNGGKIKDIKSAKVEIIHRGHSPEKVERAFDIFQKRFNPNVRNKSERIFSNHEFSKLSDESAKMLVKLVKYGILTNDQIELILLRAALDDGKLSSDDFKTITALIIDTKRIDIPNGIFIDNEDNTIN